jgi:hypothetical protein
MEEIVLLNENLDRGTFNYAGQGNSYGTGANMSAYFGFVENIEDIQDYTGA